MIRVTRTCFEKLPPPPVLKYAPIRIEEGCPKDTACYDTDGIVVLGRFIGDALRWMEEARMACSERTE